MTDTPNRSRPEGWDLLTDLAEKREAIEDAITLLLPLDHPFAIAARLRLARA